MPVPEPRYLSRHHHHHGLTAVESRWTTRRRFLATLPAPGEPPPAADYIVTGTLTPDATGNYLEDGTYNGRPAYRRADSQFWIWWSPATLWWFLSPAKGDDSTCWIRWFDTVEGDYWPMSNATGIPTVTAA